MIKKTFQTKGIAFASETALKNVQDLAKLMDWNIKNKLLLYRLSGDMFPWMSEYEFNDLPDISTIQKILKRTGEKAMQAGARITFHPGQFDVLATNNPAILQNTIKDLRQHGEILDMLSLPKTPFSKINIHVGASYGDKPAAIKRFIENFQLLPENVKSRLTVENDDKENMFSVKDLLEIHQAIRIPIVFDFLHHQFCTGGFSEEEALRQAVATWPAGITPIVHYSSSKKNYEDKTCSEVAHADYIYHKINNFGLDLDVMLEAKAKEKASIRYIEEYRVKL